MSAKSIPTKSAVVSKSDTNYLTDVNRVLANGAQTATSVDIETSTITLEDHGLNNGDTIQTTDVGSVEGISKNVIYYVVEADTDTFQLAATLGGAAIEFSGDDTTLPSWMKNTKLITNQITGCLYVGGAGDVAVLPVDHDDTDDATPAANGAVIFKSVPAGTFLPVEVKKVFSTGTTATNMLCVYYQP